jgi:hypothetical protein
MTDKFNPNQFPEGSKGGKAGRAALNAASGAIPFAGGLLSAAASVWSEQEQSRINEFLRNWLKMLTDEMQEKQQTILELTARIDVKDEKVEKRIHSPEYQSLLKKSFRDWAGAESKEKRILLRNILSNAASTQICSDDVVRLFLEWIKDFSELHFAVIAKVYNSGGITRGQIWERLGKPRAREDSADADLFKLLIRDLSTGGIVRQHRETDWSGNFVRRAPERKAVGQSLKPIVSAFDNEERYDLTALGQQFVHYSMTEVPIKIAYAPRDDAA